MAEKIKITFLGTGSAIPTERRNHPSIFLEYKALMETEDCLLEFTEAGIQRLAEVAFQVNEATENIGARRLHTVMERLLESISFSDYEAGGTVTIDEDYVNSQLGELVEDEDLSRYIL